MKTSTTDFLMNAIFVPFICLTCVTFTIQAQRPPSVHSQAFPELREQIQGMVQEAEELRASGKHEAAEETMNRARKLRHQLAERMGRRGDRAPQSQDRPHSEDFFNQAQALRSGPPPMIESIHQAVQEIREWTRHADSRESCDDFGELIQHLEHRVEDLAQRWERFERLEQELEQTHHRMRELGEALEHAHRLIEEQQQHFHHVEGLHEKVHQLEQHARETGSIHEHIGGIEEHIGGIQEHLEGMDRRIAEVEERMEARQR